MLQQLTQYSPSKKTWLWLSVGVLLIGAMAILSHVDELGLWYDELWTVFHSSTRIPQIIAERDITWPPGSFLVLHAWAKFASWNDFSLHTFGALLGLLSTACLIRAGRYLGSRTIGLLTGLAFVTSSYIMYFTLEVRGYSQLLFLESLFLLIHFRWLKRPNIVRSAMLIAVQVAMLYIHFILGVVIAFAFIHVALSAPRKLWRWLIVTAVTGLAFLPMLPQFRYALQLRSNLPGELPNYLRYGLDAFYRAFSSHSDIVFGIILLLAIVGLVIGLLRTKTVKWATLVWLGIWGIGFTAYAYITREKSAMYSTRYLLFVVPALFLLIGIGLANIPLNWSRKSVGGWIGAVLLLILAIAPWHPYDHRTNESDNGAPVHKFMRTLAERWQQGDVLVVDPNMKEYDPLTAAYYTELYFPTEKIPMAVDGSTSARRVWYLVREGSEDANTQASVGQGRIRTTNFFGTWYFITTLYAGAPSTQGVLFGDGLRFHGADVIRRHALHAGDTVPVTLWWSVDKPLPPELSMSIQLLNPSGQVVAQLDGFPKTQGTPDQLDQWQPNTLYLDKRVLEVPYQLQAGDYRLQLVVYRWQDGTRIAPATGGTPDQTLIIDSMPLYSFGAW